METEQEIIEDILSHKYYVRGKCVNCSTEFEKMTNSRGIKSCCCSDECYKKVVAKRISRGKEIHHYEVFKDDKFYYIKDNGVFNEKRTFIGKTWNLKPNSKIKIPDNALKIIDKKTPYLYDKNHPFGKWKELRGLNLASDEGI